MKRNPAFTEAVLRGMEDMVRVVGDDNGIVYQNPVMTRILGAPAGRKCYEVLGKKARCRNCTSRMAIAEGRVMKKEERVGDKIFSVVSSPVFDQEGETLYAVEVFRDETDSRRLEKALLQKNRAMERDLNFAKRLQQRLLPRTGRTPAGGAVYAKYLPCERLGGDIFDLFEIDRDRTGFFMADVSGHGIRSSMMTLFIRQTLRSLGGGASDPLFALRTLRNRYLELRPENDQYITLVFGVVDRSAKELRLAGGGHNAPPVVLNRQGVRKLSLKGLPICVLDFPDGFESLSMAYEPGDRLVLGTDGLLEARGPEGAFYGGRLLEYVLRHRHEPVADLGDGLIRDVLAFSEGRIDDDMALMIMECA